MSAPPTRTAISGSAAVLQAGLIELWALWLPYLVAAGALLVLGVWSAVGVVSRRRSRPIGPRWIAPAPAFVVPAAALVILGWVAVSLADAVREDDGLSVFDRPVWQWMVEHRTAAWTALLRVVTTIGSTVGMFVVAVVVIGLLLWRRHRGDAAMVAVVGIGAALLVFAAKRLIGRDRPPAAYRLATEDTFSFPSGHALASSAILGICVVLLVRSGPWAARWVRIVAVTAIVGFWLTIGISRVYLGVHWATDVLAGWTSGVAWLIVCLTTRRLFRSWRDNRRAGGATATEPGMTDADPDTGRSA